MRIALVQERIAASPEETIEVCVNATRRAAEEGAQLVAFAELAFWPFFPQHRRTPETIDYSETIPGPTTNRFAALAKELGIVIVLNLYERDGDSRFDSSPIIDADGSIKGVARMVHITDYPCFHEQDYYTPGDKGAVVCDTKVGRIGVAICYDRHFPEYMRALGLKGAQLVVVPQAGTVDEWPDGLYEAELRVAAFQNGYFTALVNRVGEEGGMKFAGESFVTDPSGNVITRAPKNEDGVLYADLAFALIEKSPAHRLFLKNRRPEIYPLT